jgi:AraC-like DNA-binding protein
VRPRSRRAVRRQPSSRHARNAALVGYVFQELDLAISLWEPGVPHSWHVIYERHVHRDLFGRELEHGVETERVAYNNRCIAQARRSRRTVVGRHSGFCDLFVPLREADRVDSVLVSGPFATARPTGIDVLEGWRSLTGRNAHPSDPEFSAYLATTLSVLVLDKAEVATLQKLTQTFASLMLGEGSADALYSEIQSHHARLAQARFVDRMWDLARSMLDEQTRRIWESPNMARRLREVGVNRLPQQVAVGFLVNREPPLDPVDEMLRRDAFQRASVELARVTGDVICGRIGGHGVAFLSSHGGSRARARRRLIDVAEQAASLARRRFGLSMHVGTGVPTDPLDAQYQAALAAAESAASGGSPVASAGARPTSHDLLLLERELGAHLEESPTSLPARFDRYLEMVGARSRFRLDAARTYAEVGFGRIAEAIGECGVLDVHGLSRLRASVERSAGEAGSVNELFAVYRRAVNDVADLLSQPRSRLADRNVARAEEYIRRHYAEALSLRKVSHLAGFSPTYFSELFHKHQGKTFEAHLMQLRVERAKQLLSGTSLNLERVARLSGLSSRSYLGRVFKRVTGQTPIAYRNEVLLRLRVGNASRTT